MSFEPIEHYADDTESLPTGALVLQIVVAMATIMGLLGVAFGLLDYLKP
jgi:hypothetical protein